jgi:hypothetical protein
VAGGYPPLLLHFAASEARGARARPPLPLPHLARLATPRPRVARKDQVLRDQIGAQTTVRVLLLDELTRRVSLAEPLPTPPLWLSPLVGE